MSPEDTMSVAPRRPFSRGSGHLRPDQKVPGAAMPQDRDAFNPPTPGDLLVLPGTGAW